MSCIGRRALAAPHQSIVLSTSNQDWGCILYYSGTLPALVAADCISAELAEKIRQPHIKPGPRGYSEGVAHRVSVIRTPTKRDPGQVKVTLYVRGRNPRHPLNVPESALVMPGVRDYFEEVVRHLDSLAREAAQAIIQTNDWVAAAKIARTMNERDKPRGSHLWLAWSNPAVQH